MNKNSHTVAVTDV